MSDAPGRATRDAGAVEDPSDGAQHAIQPGVEAVSPAGGGTGVFVPLTYRLPSTSRRRNRTRSRGASFRSEPGAPGAAPEAPASSVASFGSCPSMLGTAEPGMEELATTGAAEVSEGEPVSSSLRAVASSSAPVGHIATARPLLAPDPSLLGFSDPLMRQAPLSSAAAGVPHLTQVMRMTSLDSERGHLSSSSLPLMPLDLHAIALPEDVFTPLFIETCSSCAANCDCPSCVACRQQVAAAVGSAAAAANLALTTIHHHTCSKTGAGGAATAAAAAAAAAAATPTAGAAAAAASTAAVQAQVAIIQASTPPAADPSRVDAPGTPAEPSPSPPACSSTEPYGAGPPAAALDSSHQPRQQLQVGYAGAAPGLVHHPPRRRHTLPRFQSAVGQTRATMMHSPPAYGGATALAAGPGLTTAGAGYSPPGVWMFPGAPGYPPGYMYPAYAAMARGYTMWQPQQQPQQQQQQQRHQPAYGQEELPMVPLPAVAAAGGGGGSSHGEGWQAARPLPPTGRAFGAPVHAAAGPAMSVRETGPQPVVSPSGARQPPPQAGSALPSFHSPTHAGASFGRGPPAMDQSGTHGVLVVGSSGSSTPAMEWLAPPRRSPFSAGPSGGRGRVHPPLQQQQQQQQHGSGVEVEMYGQSGSRSGATSMVGPTGASSSSHSADTSSYAGARQGGSHSNTSSYGATPGSSQLGSRWWHKQQEDSS